MAVWLELDQFSLEKLYMTARVLKQDAPKAIARGTNATAREAKTILAEKAQETFLVKKGGFKRAIKQKNATPSNLEATLTVTGKRISLREFAVRKNTGKTAAKAHIKRSTSFKELTGPPNKAFLAQVKGSKGGIGRFIAQRKGKSRNPIVKMVSLSDPQMIGNQDVYGLLKPRLSEMLLRHTQKETAKLLAKR